MGANLSYPDEDLSGKVALVTGGNTGIGYETAKALARLGAHTFIACRSEERAEQAIERMKKELAPTIPEGGNEKIVAQVSPVQKEDDKKEEQKKDGQNKGEQQDEQNKGDQQDEQKKGDQQDEQKEDEHPRVEAEGTESKENENKSKKDEQASVPEGQAAVITDEVKGKVEAGEKTKEVKVEYIPLDLASFQSTKECVRIFKERELPLHILVNNAAVAWIPFSVTGDGFETQFQVNHLGPMLLTLELLPVLINTAESSGDVRICFVSSRAHSAAQRVDVNKLVVTKEEEYSRLRTYPNTKLYNIMVATALQRRLEGSAITVSSPEPGTVKTELQRGWADLTSATLFTKLASAVTGRTPAEGAATSINCVVNPKLNTRQHYYYSSCKPTRPDSEALDQSKQEALWNKSIEILKDHLSQDILDKYGATTKEPTSKDTPAVEKQEDSEAAALDKTGTAEAENSELVTSEPTVPDTSVDDAQKTSTDDAGGATASEEPLANGKVEELGDTNEVPSDQKGTQESLPKEPMKEREEEQEINPPENGEEPDKKSDVADKQSTQNEGNAENDTEMN